LRIDRLRIENFKGFKSCEIDFDPHFNVLIGDNASGKTTVLDALAIAVDSWFFGLKSDEKPGGIDLDQVRVVPYHHGSTFTFEKQFPVRIEAHGEVMGQQLSWTRELTRESSKNTSRGAKDLISVAAEADRKVRANEPARLPLICSYGTERLWYESRHHKAKKVEKEVTPQSPSRFDGYRDCNYFQIQETALLEWMRAQVFLGQQIKRETTEWQVMQQAIVSCVDGALSVYWDEVVKDLVVEIHESGRQMFRNLSDGQRIMLTLIGDLVKRATTLNDLGDKVLEETDGIVLIDELDLHLHPRWQRRVIQDLKNLFPRVQFIATTHSPQLVGEALPNEVRILADGAVSTPSRSFGIDSSRILSEMMHVSPRNSEVEETLKRLSGLVDTEDLGGAKQVLSEVERQLGKDDPEVTGASTLIHLLESTQ